MLELITDLVHLIGMMLSSLDGFALAVVLFLAAGARSTEMCCNKGLVGRAVLPTFTMTVFRLSTVGDWLSGYNFFRNDTDQAIVSCNIERCLHDLLIRRHDEEIHGQPAL